MFYVRDNEEKYTGFDDARDAVKAYRKATENTPSWDFNRDIGLLITKEPIAGKPIEQVMQGKDWVALSCASQWNRQSQNLFGANLATIMQDWIRFGSCQ